MSYPGNASLAQDIQDRILETFQQTLELVESDSLNEARLGCDFILRLDPMFEPARWLQDRLDASGGEIVLDDLKAAIADPLPAAGADSDETLVAEGTAPDEEETLVAETAPDSGTAAPAAEATPGGEAEAAEAISPDSEEMLVADDETLVAGDEPAPATEAEPEADRAAEPTDADLASEGETLVAEEPAADEETLTFDGDEGEAELELPETLDDPDPDAANTQATAFAEGDSEPTPATAAEVASAPVAALDTESEKRVTDLLAEGQGAFDRGEYQTAIDAWSRIFLIDIDHPEASERIEAARKLKAEAERTVEEAFHEALASIESGATDEGRAGLEKVLEMQPDHLAAREQLERLDSAPPAAAAAPPAETEPEPTAPTPPEAPPEAGEPLGGPEEALSDIDASLELDGPAPAGDIGGQIEPIPVPKPKKRPPAAAGPTDKKKILLYVGAGLLALVLVGGGFLAMNWSSFFPNTTEPVETPGERPNPIERAEELHLAGKTSTAIAQLKRLPPNHELYSEAQALVAQWEAAAAAESEEIQLTEADLEEFDSLVAQATAAQERGEFLRVDELLTRASAIQPLDGDAASLKLAANAELEPIRTQVAIFQQGEWERALRDLWRLREEMPDNVDIDRLMIDSYYNLGVRALQRGDTTSATEHFDEALALAGNDPDLRRASRFAQTYQNRPEDLLFRIYVKYLPFR